MLLVRTRSEHLAAREDDAVHLEAPHLAVWHAIRNLFPPHAMVSQTDYGCMLVSWTLRDGRRACTQFAAPIMIRLRSELMLALWTSDPKDREAIAHAQADVVREALAGYDPHTHKPTSEENELGGDD